VDAELNHESSDHSEKTGAVVEPVLQQVVETIHTSGSPLPVHLDDEISSTRLKCDPERGRGWLVHDVTLRAQEWGFYGGSRDLEVRHRQRQENSREGDAAPTDGNTT
jgi:hypothetical protein